MSPYLIWSIEHDAWWKPAERGYTRIIGEAGIYSHPTSTRILNGANQEQVNECRIPVECLFDETKGEKPS